MWFENDTCFNGIVKTKEEFDAVIEKCQEWEHGFDEVMYDLPMYLSICLDYYNDYNGSHRVIYKYETIKSLKEKIVNTQKLLTQMEEIKNAM